MLAEQIGPPAVDPQHVNMSTERCRVVSTIFRIGLFASTALVTAGCRPRRGDRPLGVSMGLTLAPTDIYTSSKVVPAEFRGLARVFRDRFAAEDRASGETVSRLDARIRTRVKGGNPIPRRDTLTGAARGWRERLPPLSRLALEIDLQQRGKALTIREMRLSSSEYRDAAWTEAERGLVVMMIGLACGPFRYEFTKHTLCHVSHHALARRMERGSDTSDAAIKRDLKLLGQAQHGLADAANGTDFTVPVPGGNWLGNVALMRNPRGSFDVALAVRTYLADGL